MKTAGIVGGLGPESTLEYYRLTIAAWRERRQDGHYPALLINSIDLKVMLDLVAVDARAEMADRLVAAVEALARGGAECGLLSANTPHLVFDEVERRSPIPLVSIVKATRDACAARGIRRVGLLGTRFTMQGRFYPDVFTPAGIEIVTPDAAEQAYIHEVYVNQLVKGVFLPETHARLLAIITAMKSRDRVEGVILGGTELPLILRESEVEGIPLLDTGRIHVEALVDLMLERDPEHR